MEIWPAGIFIFLLHCRDQTSVSKTWTVQSSVGSCSGVVKGLTGLWVWNTTDM
jgi:hypothetical protein